MENKFNVMVKSIQGSEKIEREVDFSTADDDTLVTH